MTETRNLQLLRILGMIRDLSVARNGVSIQDLRDRYGVTRRTVERDLLAIEEAGYDIETLITDDLGKVRKRIRTATSEMLLPVTSTELAAARAGVASLERDAPTAVVSVLRMLVNRLEGLQSRAVSVDADVLAQAQAIAPRPHTLAVADAGLLDLLNAAILRCERLRIGYRKGGMGEPRAYLVEPYGILYGEKGYLVWRGVEDRQWRLFALPSIDKAAFADASFVRDPDFVLSDFAAQSFGIYREKPFDVVLHILPSGLHRLQNHSFHPTQVVERREGGGAIVRFSASGLIEMSWHLFTWGEDLRILAPVELIETYSAQLKAARAALGEISA